MVRINLEAGPKGKVPDEIYVVVEIPKGLNLKYEFRDGSLFLDRVLRYNLFLPGDYGIIPSTLAEDGDNLDCVVLVNHANFPGSVIRARPIGYLEMEDEKGIDKKVIAVPVKDVDPSFSKIKNINDVSKYTLAQIRFYFEHYKSLEEGKWTKIGKFKNAKQAKMLIKKSIKAYKEQNNE